MTTLVCAACSQPVERCFDDDYQHVSGEDDLACTTWPVRPARSAKFPLDVPPEAVGYEASAFARRAVEEKW